MGIIIILFFIAIILAFMMLSYQTWEIKTLRAEKNNNPKIMPEIYFRHLEKTALYVTKNIVQWVVLMTVKYWYISSAKTKKWINKNWPKISSYLKTKAENMDLQKNTFIKKAILESKIKIRRIKEKVKREHE